MKKILDALFTQFDFKKIINHELTWALFILGSLLVYVSKAYVANNDMDKVACEREIAALKIDLQKERDARFLLYDKLLNLQDTVKDQKKAQAVNDSLRKKIVQKAKHLIK